MGVSYLQFGVLASALLLGAAPPGRDRAPLEATGSPAQPAAVDWQAATREDVLEAYDIFSHHHPGMFDPNNPSFPKQLRLARDAALTFARRVHDDEGHMRAVALFNSVLSDGHARVVVGYNGHGMRWPGFTTVWRGRALYVFDAATKGPRRGSALLGCDGRDARSLIREATFLDGRSNEEGQWWVNAPMFFWRNGSSYDPLPRACTFRNPDGQATTYRLNWRPIDERVFDHWIQQWQREPVGLTQPKPGIEWITLSTFSPDEQGRAQYDRLFRDLDARSQQISAARALVIDLRNNNGGSSSWSEDVANRLWGKAAVDWALAKYFQHTQIWWFADAPNIAHLRDSAAKVRAEGRPQADEGIDFLELADRLEFATKRGKHFYIEDFGAVLSRHVTNAAPRPLPPVYVVVDGGCASACLDALDVFTRFPGVKLVGAPTSADSQYLDVRLQPLPSGRGGVWLPTKIWVHRPRRAGEVYRPDIPVNDLDWTTATMLDHIERDLARRPVSG
jgi:hypothetical protein